MSDFDSLWVLDGKIKKAIADLESVSQSMGKMIAFLRDQETAEEQANAPDRIFSLPGRFHLATGANPNRIVPPFEVPLAGSDSTLHMDFEFHTGLNLYNEGANLFWWGMPKHKNCIGLALIRRGELVLRTDFGVRHFQKKKGLSPCKLSRGYTYGVTFSYTPGGQVSVAVTDGADTVGSVTLTSNIDSYPDEKMSLGFGFPGVHRNEPAQVGWAWRNLDIIRG